MLCDYHIHSRMCGDAVGEFEEYIQQAQRKGITEIGFSGHCPQYYFPPAKQTGMCSISNDEMETYIRELEILQNRYRELLTVRIGLEVDYIPGKEEFLRPVLDRYEWDYLLLSVHFLGDWPFDDPQYLPLYAEQDINEVYRYYYRTLIQGMKTGWFDIVAHFDLPKKFGHRPSNPVPEEDEALRVCLEQGLALELNTAGLRKPVEETYPSPLLLRRARDLGVPVCLGSDAHQPEEVGMDFDRALEMLVGAGYRELSGFRKRKAFHYSMPASCFANDQIMFSEGKGMG